MKIKLFFFFKDHYLLCMYGTALFVGNLMSHMHLYTDDRDCRTWVCSVEFAGSTDFAGSCNWNTLSDCSCLAVVTALR